VKITVFGYKFYKSRDFMLYTFIQQLPEFLQLGDIQGCPKSDSTASSLVFKKAVLNITTFVKSRRFCPQFYERK
jgi:hypothetical protein